MSLKMSAVPFLKRNLLEKVDLEPQIWKKYLVSCRFSIHRALPMAPMLRMLRPAPRLRSGRQAPRGGVVGAIHDHQNAGGFNMFQP